RLPQEGNGRKRLVRHGAVARFQPIYPEDSQTPCARSTRFRVATHKRRIPFAVRHVIGEAHTSRTTRAFSRNSIFRREKACLRDLERTVFIGSAIAGVGLHPATSRSRA